MNTWTPEEVLEYAKSGKVPRRARPMPKARGRRNHTPGTMNKTEARYADELKAMVNAGEIEWWAFEPVKLKLADKTYYTPDFCVMHNDGTIDFIETKGFWEDDARVKIKVAAKLFPMFQFVALIPKAKKDGGGWKRETF